MLRCNFKNNIRSFFKFAIDVQHNQKLRTIKPSLENIYFANSGRYIFCINYIRYVIPAIRIEKVPYAYYPLFRAWLPTPFSSPNTTQLRNPNNNIENLQKHIPLKPLIQSSKPYSTKNILIRPNA